MSLINGFGGGNIPLVKVYKEQEIVEYLNENYTDTTIFPREKLFAIQTMTRGQFYGYGFLYYEANYGDIYLVGSGGLRLHWYVLDNVPGVKRWDDRETT